MSSPDFFEEFKDRLAKEIQERKKKEQIVQKVNLMLKEAEQEFQTPISLDFLKQFIRRIIQQTPELKSYEVSVLDNLVHHREHAVLGKDEGPYGGVGAYKVAFYINFRGKFEFGFFRINEFRPESRRKAQ